MATLTEENKAEIAEIAEGIFRDYVKENGLDLDNVFLQAPDPIEEPEEFDSYAKKLFLTGFYIGEDAANIDPETGDPERDKNGHVIIMDSSKVLYGNFDLRGFMQSFGYEGIRVLAEDIKRLAAEADASSEAASDAMKAAEKAKTDAENAKTEANSILESVSEEHAQIEKAVSAFNSDYEKKTAEFDADYTDKTKGLADTKEALSEGLKTQADSAKAEMETLKSSVKEYADAAKISEDAAKASETASKDSEIAAEEAKKKAEEIAATLEDFSDLDTFKKNFGTMQDTVYGPAGETGERSGGLVQDMADAQKDIDDINSLLTGGGEDVEAGDESLYAIVTDTNERVKRMLGLVAKAPEMTVTVDEERDEFKVTLTKRDPDGRIFYTSDGTDPTAKSNEYTEVLTYPKTADGIFIKAIVKDGEKVLSDVASFSLDGDLSGDAPQCPMPEITVSEAGLVAIVQSDPEADIYYTIDGSDPTDKNSIKYSNSFYLKEISYNIRAVVVKPWVAASKVAVKSGSLSIEVPTPTIEKISNGFKVSIPEYNPVYTVRLEYSFDENPKEVTATSEVAFESGSHEKTIILPKTSLSVYAKAFDSNGIGGSATSSKIDLSEGDADEKEALSRLSSGDNASIEYRNSKAKFVEISEESLYWGLAHSYAGLFPGMHFTKDYKTVCVGTSANNANTVAIGELGRYRKASSNNDYSQIAKNHAYMVHLDYDGEAKYESTNSNTNGFAGSALFSTTIGGSGISTGINKTLSAAFGSHLITNHTEKLIGTGSGSNNATRTMTSRTVIYRPLSVIELGGAKRNSADTNTGADSLGQIALFRLLPALIDAKAASGGKLNETSSAKAPTYSGQYYWTCVPSGASASRFVTRNVPDSYWSNDNASSAIALRGGFLLGTL